MHRRKTSVWSKLNSLVCVCADGRQRADGDEDGERGRMGLGEEGRNELNNNGRLLLTFAKEIRLALLITFPTRRGGTWHTCNGVSGNERWRLVYILSRQTHRNRVSNITVIPQPERPAKADSDHNMVVANGRPSWPTCPQPSCEVETQTAVVQPTVTAGEICEMGEKGEVLSQLRDGDGAH